MRQREKKYNRKAVTVLLSLVLVVFWVSCQTVDDTREYYIDSIGGDDHNSGTSENSPWKTLEKVSSMTFLPGDRIYFKRGSSYSGCVTINGDGTASDPITISAYGTGDAPSFTNPNYSDNTGNAMRIRGDYHIVEDLYFHHTAPAPPSAGFETVWSVGALHVSLGHDHVIIRNNEFANTPKAIQSYSEYSLITNNYIHDGNSSQFNGFLSRPYWGPIGIHLGIGNQEVSYNTIENMYVVGGKWGGDGSAIEIDDGRNHKDNIHIHHNTTEHNMGFLEVSWWADFGKMSSTNVTIDHNVSRDYQQFVLWWAPTSASTIENNTIIRTDNEFYGPFDGVFFFDARPADVTLTRNIVVTDNDLTEAIFVQDYDGGIYDVTHTNNCYWDVADGNPDIGLPLGPGEIITDPLFVDYAGKDYDLQPGSPCAGWGALADTPPPASDLMLSRSDYQDRLRAFWLSECIANWTGIQTEGDRTGRLGRIPDCAHICAQTGAVPSNDQLLQFHIAIWPRLVADQRCGGDDDCSSSSRLPGPATSVHRRVDPGWAEGVTIIRARKGSVSLRPGGRV